MNGGKHISEAPAPTRPETKHEVGKLLHRKHEAVDRKDFHAELRGLLDISSLLDKCSVLLDVEVCDQHLS